MKRLAVFASVSAMVLCISQPKLCARPAERVSWYQEALFNIHFGPCPRTFTAVSSPDYPAQIRELIRRTGATMLQFHASSQHGFANYPSAAGITNPALDGVDIIKVWREVTRELGVKFFAYMSYGDSRAEGEAHPEFLRVNGNGEQDGRLCPNTPYGETYILPKTREVIEKYDPDGFWFDAGIWAMAPCYCRYCTSEFRQIYGQDPPRDEMSPLWHTFAEFQRKNFEELNEKVGNLIHSLSPDCIFCPNYSFTLYQPEPVPGYVDIISGDVGGFRRARMTSFKARFSDTQGPPWDIMVGNDFLVDLPGGRFKYPKSIDYLNQNNAIVRANGGITSIWTTPNRDGSLSPFYTELLGNASDFIRERIGLFRNTTPVRDVGILHSAMTFYGDGDGYCRLQPGMDRLRGAHLALVQSGYHVNLFADYDLSERLSEYRVVILADQVYLSPETAAALREYVRRGGSIVVAGRCAMKESPADRPSSLLGDVLGIEFLPGGPAKSAFIDWNGLPIAIACPWYPVRPVSAQSAVPLLEDGNELDKRTRSSPCITVNRFGDGMAVYVSGDIFTAYYQNQFPGIREAIARAMLLADDDRPFESDAPVSIEFAIRRRNNDTIIHMVNLLVDWDMDEPGAVHPGSVPPAAPFHVKVKCDKRPRTVTLEPSGRTPEWNWRSGYVWASIPSIHIHEALVLSEAY